MKDIETLVMQNYEKNISYFKKKHPTLSKKLQALELLLGEGKYPQKYDLEYKEGYFDVVELASGNFLYGANSYEHAQKKVDAINWKKDEHTIETFYRYNFNDEDVKNVKKRSARDSYATTAPLIHYCNQNLEANASMKQIYKFMFFGTGLGLHVEKIVAKTGANIFLIVESDLELFRLSLFTCNYAEAFQNRVAFFAIAQNSAEFSQTFSEFYEYIFIRNHYLKFSLFSSKDEIYIKTIQSKILTRSENCYPHTALLDKSFHVLEKIDKGYKFLSMLKKDEAFFEDKPFLVLGAGPSLGNNKEWLVKHHKNFIIVAPFVTLRVLYPLEIAPDIIVHIDENVKVVAKDIESYQEDENYFEHSLFIFNASVSEHFFDAFKKESIYLVEDRTHYKLNDNYLDVVSVGESVYGIALSLTKGDIYLLGLDLALGDDGATHARVHGSGKNRVDTTQAKSIAVESDINKSVLEVKGNFRAVVNTIPLFEMSIRHMNRQTQKYKLEGQNIYNLNDGAFFEKTIPLEISQVAFEDESALEYGALYTDYHLTFYGFYKQTDSDKLYDVDVYIDEVFKETLDADKTLEQVENKFDISGNSFEYRLPQKYVGEIHNIAFKEHISGDVLAGSGINTLSEEDTGFNEFRFMDSLNHVDEEKIKDLYCKDAIGFLATKENLEDADFVNYINQIMQDFPNVIYRALVLNKEMEIKIKSNFSMPLLEIVELKCIDDIYENIEVYLSNYERTYNNLYENSIVQHLRDNSTNIFCQGLGLNQINLSVGKHEENNVAYFSKFFNNMEYLGFNSQDIKKYGESFHEISFKKASEKYNVDIDFNLNESVSKAYVYWNLKLGLTNHNFFKYAIKFAKKFARLQL